LHRHHPELTYLASLVAFFDNAPRGEPALPFRDDPPAEVQVVSRPGAEAVLVCFCARNSTLGVPLNFMHRWLGRLPASLIYVKDFRHLYGSCGFPGLGGDRQAAATALRRMAREELGGTRIYTLGVSHGGFSALYYGLLLDAVAAINFAGAT